MEEKPAPSLPTGAEKFGSPVPMAIAGIILVSGLLIAGYCGVRFFQVSRALHRGNNVPAQMLRNINSAQAVYESGIGGGNYASNLAVLGGDMPPKENEVGLLESTTVNAQTRPKSGYLLGKLKTVPRTATSPARYSITAFPVGETGKDCYYIDETGIIRHSGRPDVPATASSPPLEEKK